MSKKVLTTPIQDKDLEDIKIGDVIYLTGTLVTARDAAHTRLVKLGRKLPVDLKGKAIFHIVGKGGMGPNTTAGCKETKALHCVFPGGCAVVAAECVEEVEDCQWPELGMPEAMWVMRVKEFGPLVVSIDAHGNNLFEKNKKHFNELKDPIVEEINKHVSFIQ